MDTPEKEQEKKKRRRKRRAATTAVAAVTSAGVVMGGLFSSPDDLLNGENGGETPIHMSDTMAPDGDGGDGDGLDEEETFDEEEDRRRGGLRSRARSWIWGWPVGVRALIGVPLWALGWLILTGGAALWSGVLSPVFGTVLGWVLTAAVLLGAFVLSAKAMFPDLPLKKIVTKQNFLLLLIGTAVLAIAEAVVPLFWDGYGKIAQLVRAVGSAGLLGAAIAWFARRENRRRKKAAERAERPKPRETMDQALRRARELADSVKSQ